MTGLINNTVKGIAALVAAAVLSSCIPTAKYYNDYGADLGRQGKIEEAITQLEKAVEIDPYAPKPYYNLGYAYSKQGRFDKAIIELKKAVELDPDYAKAHYYLGLAYEEKEKYGEAEKHYKKALELIPDNASAQNHLLFVSRMLKKEGVLVEFPVLGDEIDAKENQKYDLGLGETLESLVVKQVEEKYRFIYKYSDIHGPVEIYKTKEDFKRIFTKIQEKVKN